MMREILIASHKTDQIDIIKDLLENDFSRRGEKLIFHEARNEAHARGLAETEAREYHLLIAHVHLPADRKTPLREEEQRGLGLFRALRADHIETPGILMSVSGDAKLNAAIHKLSNVLLVIEGEKWEEDLLSCCNSLLSGIKERTQQKRGKLDLSLDLDNRTWIYQLTGAGVDQSGLLSVDHDVMQGLVRRSKRIQEIPNEKWQWWQEELEDIGKALMTQLFKRNQDLATSFATLASRMDGVENIMIRFIVEKNIHALTLEALVDATDKYFMLSTPVYRKIQTRVMGYPDPLTQRSPANCLIIEADAHGYVDAIKDSRGQGLMLKKASNIPEEAAWLERYLQDHRSEFNIGNVHSIKTIDEKDFATRVQTVLGSDVWDFVHFAGHSYYQPNTCKGYVFFPGEYQVPVPMDIEDFSVRLRQAKTKLVYLSSCQSSEEDFAFELANRNIPAIIGFRWDIDDEKAAAHAKLFYEHFFKGDRSKGSLEYAFLETRKAMYEKYKTDKIWVAPMLILQLSH